MQPRDKLFNNMRASRATELVKAHPLQVAAAWMGHTPEVMAKHYLQVREGDYRSAAQNPAQYRAESGRAEREAVGAGMQNHPELPSDSATYVSIHNRGLTPRGFEPLSPP